MAFTDRLHNRGSVSTGYDIEYSNKFESDAGEGIIRNYDASTGANCIANNSTTNAKKFTVSYWVKKTELLASGQNIPWIAIAGGNATVVKFQDEKFAAYDDSAGWSLATNALFRDTSAWYHLVCAVDTTQSTASDRVNLYVNGVLQTSFSTENYGTQNNDNQLWKVNTGHQIGNQAYFKGGYIAELHCIDGTQYAASDFGEYDDDSGIWIPKEADVTYGDQGYYLNWSDFGSANSNANNTGVGKDFSGNTNPFVNLANWSSADIATDTPTNNFCTLNVVQASSKNAGGNNEYTEGATKGKALQESELASGTMAVTQGKWYYECKGVLNSEIMAGWGVPNLWGHHTANPGYDDYSFAVHNIGRVYYSGNAFIDLSPSVSFDTTDIVSCAIDIDNGFCYWAKNGTWMNGGVPTSGSTGTGGFDFQSASAPGNLDIAAGDFLIPAFRTNYYTNSAILVNFGGFTTISISSAESDADGYGTFEYAPPSGYYALCTKNLAEYG